VTENQQHAGAAFDQEIDRGGIVKIGIWLAVVTVAGFLIAWLAYRALASGAAQADPAPSPIAAAREQPLPPGPQLQPRPEEELARYRAQVSERLSTWGWVDREKNVAHVPIERAIEMVAEQAAEAPAPDEAASEEAATEGSAAGE